MIKTKKKARKQDSFKDTVISFGKYKPNTVTLVVEFKRLDYVSFPVFFEELKEIAKQFSKYGSSMEEEYSEFVKEAIRNNKKASKFKPLAKH